MGAPDSNPHQIPEYIIDDDRRRYDAIGVTVVVNTLRTESFKLFKRPFLGFLIILTL